MTLNTTVSVTSVSLNKASLSMNVGETQTLIATVSPSNATNKAVTWSSDNTSVATVSSSGVVTTKAAGSATIIVKTRNGGKTATCKVTVTDATVSVTSISLNKASLSMKVGETQTLKATVYPTNATNKAVVWYSSNLYVATVNTSSALVAAKADGRASITVETSDGHKTATCQITVTSDDSENGHAWVDLGLPSGLKWATCNVGASSAVEYGDYFAWGETGTRSQYGRWTTYKWSNGSSLTKYGVVDKKRVLELDDDAARVNWGGNWKMPTYKQWKELVAKCSWTWTSQNGTNGYLVTSRTNSNSIFLPAAGYVYGPSIWVNERGYYWSSTLYTDSPNRAYLLNFPSFEVRLGSHDRYDGLSVRPVTQ